MADVVSKSWFAVFDNPQKHGYEGSPKAICDQLMAEWCIEDGRAGAWAYCVKHYCGHYPIKDEEGNIKTWRLAISEEEKALVPPDLPHVHMVLEAEKAMRFSFVKNTYAIGMHFEGTKGTKNEAEDYISKTGKYSEKEKREAGFPWEEILYVSRYGTIRGRQGQRSDIQIIANLINEGKTPKEILSLSFSFYRYETYIRKAYFDKVDRETPIERDVRVIWHTGESGSGKSYSRLRLAEVEGEDRVFYLTDFGPGMFDKYCGEKFLWIEDFKGEVKFGNLLRMLDIYKCELPARYTNAKALWTEVHITSVYHPLAVYRKMLKDADQSQDKADQLLRRISVIRYHWKDKDGGYHEQDFPPTASMEDMRRACLPEEPRQTYEPPENRSGYWQTITSDDELPFSDH